MFGAFVLSALFRSTLMQMDYSCTDIDAMGAVNFAASSTRGCTDQFPTAICSYLFSDPRGFRGAIAGTTATLRGFACYKNGAMLDPYFKQAGITFCPLYCGYCCLTPENNCPNSPAPRLDCGTITDDMCESPLWRELIAADCPGRCGFCLLGGCVDAAPDCATQPTICSNTALSSFTQSNCQRTCGLCGNGTTTAMPDCIESTTISMACTDRSSDCALWRRNGFCSSIFYTEEQKRDYCPSTCNLC